VPSTRTILIVDNNLGFVLWAGWELQNAGYDVLPATTISRLFRKLPKPRISTLSPDRNARAHAGTQILPVIWGHASARVAMVEAAEHGLAPTFIALVS
jgi:hypothetical protein